MLKTNESVGLITTDTDLPTRPRNKQIGEIGLQIFGNTKVNPGGQSWNVRQTK